MYNTESLLSQYLKGMTNLGGTKGAPDVEAPTNVNYAEGIGEGGNFIDTGFDQSGAGEETYDPSAFDVTMGALQYPFMGAIAADSVTEGQSNTALGYGALQTDTKGARAVALGFNALGTQNFTSAYNNYNIGIGYDAGGALTTGVSNVLIGG